LVADASQYKLSVDGSSGNIYNAWTGTCDSSTCSATPTLNLASGNYTWKVQTSNAAGLGPESSTMAFSVVTPPTPPAPVTLIGPSGRNKDNPITYSWYASNASWYQLLVNGPDGAVVQLWMTAGDACGGGTVCSATLDDVMLPVASYTWYIQASNDASTGPWSSPMTFRTRQPPKAVLVSPSGSAVNPVTFTWNQVNAALWFRVQVRSSKTVVFDQWFIRDDACSAGTCSVTPTALSLPPATYNWRVQTSLDASSGTWSDRVYFTIS
jgi:hypothetical protein